MAHINCGHCRTTLMYPYGAPSVKCAVCHYVTNVGTISECLRLSGLKVVVPNFLCFLFLGFLSMPLLSKLFNSGAISLKLDLTFPGVAIDSRLKSTGNVRCPLPASRLNATGTMPSTSTSQTVVVENPMSVDESGKL
ncbi:hypothetical protein Golax_007607, partial [Gossypium laxum]|nr:hypothetical protein [Gossypium laxum]